MLLTKAEIALPDSVEVSGKWYKIKTDYRDWLRFFEIIKTKPETYNEFDFLYIGNPPENRSAVHIEIEDVRETGGIGYESRYPERDDECDAAPHDLLPCCSFP